MNCTLYLQGPLLQLILLLSCIVHSASPCPFCPVAPANTASIAILSARIETVNANHIREVEERRAEEKCANKLLQDQIKEIQDKLNTHINVCVFTTEFRALEKVASDDFVPVSSYRDYLLDNSRVLGKRVPPKKLINTETGAFEVPNDAAGDYMFSATIHADTFEAEEEPSHRQANWAIVKKGAESKALDELTSVGGDLSSAGVMFANTGSSMKQDHALMSKTVYFSLRAGDQVHLVALKDPESKLFPYQGMFITFCASLLQKAGTKVTSTAFLGEKNENPVLGIRASCMPKIGTQIPEAEATQLTSQLAKEDAERRKEKAEAILEEKQDIAELNKALAEQQHREWAKEEQAANEKRNEELLDEEEKQKEEKEKADKAEEEMKKEEKELKEKNKIEQEKHEEEIKKENDERQAKNKEKLEQAMTAIKEPEAGGEKWYLEDCCDPSSNKSVTLSETCCTPIQCNSLLCIENCCWGNDTLKHLCSEEMQTPEAQDKCMSTVKFKEKKQAEVSCFEKAKVLRYKMANDPIIMGEDVTEVTADPDFPCGPPLSNVTTADPFETKTTAVTLTTVGIQDSSTATTLQTPNSELETSLKETTSGAGTSAVNRAKTTEEMTSAPTTTEHSTLSSNPAYKGSRKITTNTFEHIATDSNFKSSTVDHITSTHTTETSFVANFTMTSPTFENATTNNTVIPEASTVADFV